MLAYDYITSPSLRRLAVLLGTAYAQAWRDKHGVVIDPEWPRLFGSGLTIAVQGGMYTNAESDQIISDMSALLSRIVEADARLAQIYTQTDIEWFIAAEDKRLALSILGMMIHTPRGSGLLTAAEAADQHGGAESWWRNEAAAGRIPGAVKKGKTWLIPAEVAEVVRNDD